MKKFLIFLLSSVLIALAGLWLWLQQQETTSLSALVAGPEATYIAKVPGHVTKLTVKKGDSVVKGQLLFQLDDRHYLETLVKAKADLAAVAAVIPSEKPATVRSGEALFQARLNESTARNAMEKLSNDVAVANITLAKAHAKQEEGKPVSAAIKAAQEKADQTRAAFTRAKDTFEHTSHVRAALEAEQRHPVPSAAPSAVLQALRTRFDTLRGLVNQAERDLQSTVTHAPFDGVVMEIHVEVGQALPQGIPAVTLRATAPDKLWVAALFATSNTDKLQTGTACRIAIDGVTQVLTGIIDRPQDSSALPSAVTSDNQPLQDTSPFDAANFLIKPIDMASTNATSNSATRTISARIRFINVDAPVPGLIPGAKARVTLTPR